MTLLNIAARLTQQFPFQQLAQGARPPSAQVVHGLTTCAYATRIRQKVPQPKYGPRHTPHLPPQRPREAKTGKVPPATPDLPEVAEPVKTRLPQEGHRGRWSGTPGQSMWMSTHPDVLRITDGTGVMFSAGYPEFKPWAVAVVAFERGVLQGTSTDARKADTRWADDLGTDPPFVRRTRKENDLVWHHVEDRRTLILLPGQLHGNIPHSGGATLLRREHRGKTSPCSAP